MRPRTQNSPPELAVTEAPNSAKPASVFVWEDLNFPCFSCHSASDVAQSCSNRASRSCDESTTPAARTSPHDSHLGYLRLKTLNPQAWHLGCIYISLLWSDLNGQIGVGAAILVGGRINVLLNTLAHSRREFHNSMRSLFSCAGVACSCFSFVLGGGATGVGNPRKTMMKNTGSRR
jgi:hypothetical protein